MGKSSITVTNPFREISWLNLFGATVIGLVSTSRRTTGLVWQRHVPPVA